MSEDDAGAHSRHVDHDHLPGTAVPDRDDPVEGWIRLVTPAGVPQAIRTSSISEVLGPVEMVPGTWVAHLTYGDRHRETVEFGDEAAARRFVDHVVVG